MSRTKLFLENFLVYGLGSILSKMAPLIMLPIVTRLMPNTTYYGLSDLSSITVTFGSSVAIMGMYDAMFRMFFEKDDILYKKEVCSSSLFFVTLNGLFLCIILFIFNSYFSQWIFDDYKYINLFNLTVITIFLRTLSSIVIAPTRMQNKRKLFLFTNTLTPIIAYSISIPMLINKNYLYALPTSALLTSLIMFLFFFLINIKWFDIKKINISTMKEMLRIGVPLMPSFLIYWIFTSCDRLMISKILGNQYVGIYGIGAKVASVSQFIYIAFSSGWQFFAFSTMKDKDQIELTSKIFEYLALVAFLCFIVITPFSNTIFRLFFVGDYIDGYLVFPYLFLSPLILMLFQTIVNQFLVIKKTWPSTIILLAGAIVNIIFNYVLIRNIGIEGAAIATLLGYATSVLLCAFTLWKIKLINVPKRFIMMNLSIIWYIMIWRTFFIFKLYFSIPLTFIQIYILYYLYKLDFNKAYKKLKNYITELKLKKKEA